MSLLRSLISRKVDSPDKQVAGAVVMVIVIAFVITQCVSTTTALHTLQHLDAADVRAIRIVGRSFDDRDAIAELVAGLHTTQHYSSEHEGCIAPYQMQITLASGQTVFYAIGRNRRNTTLLIQPAGEKPPDCLVGIMLSSPGLLDAVTKLDLHL